MCNLYASRRPAAEVRELAKAIVDTSGNWPALASVFPDSMAPIVMTQADGKRALARARWGFPSPTPKGPPLVTNLRNASSRFWKPYLKTEARCLVPFTSFCEYEHKGGKAIPTWFSLSADRPLCWFAGVTRTWTGIRGTKANPVDGVHQLFAFLTTEPNAEVAPIHEKAMPVLLLTDADREQWMTGSVEDALALQKPAPDGTLKIVATGRREDP